MNIRLTPLKSAVSVFCGIAINYSFAGTIKVYCGSLPTDIVDISNSYFAGCKQLTWLQNAFDPIYISISFVTTIIVYVVWSIFQRRASGFNVQK